MKEKLKEKLAPSLQNAVEVMEDFCKEHGLTSKDIKGIQAKIQAMSPDEIKLFLFRITKGTEPVDIKNRAIPLKEIATLTQEIDKEAERIPYLKGVKYTAICWAALSAILAHGSTQPMVNEEAASQLSLVAGINTLMITLSGFAQRSFDNRGKNELNTIGEAVIGAVNALKIQKK